MSLLELRNVNFSYATGAEVLHDVSLSVDDGVNLGIVGESGSGKSTLLQLLLGLGRPTSGTVLAEGRPVNIRDRHFMRGYRRLVQPVFQDPYSSLDPRQRVDSILTEPLRALRIPGDRQAAIRRVLSQVGLPEDAARRYPHAFSGGQRQRIAIARALIAQPRILLADEAVSALDLSTRVRIVDLIRQLASEVTLVLVSHDLAVVAALCEQLVVLEKGRVVEAGETARILAAPRHPYTRRLLASVPRMADPAG